MSMTKTFAALSKQKEELQEAVQALIDDDLLEGASLGIAKKIASEGTIEKLSEKQLYVYDKIIKSHFDITCENPDCKRKIEFEYIADAIHNHAVGDNVLCQNCQHFYNMMEKDN